MNTEITQSEVEFYQENGYIIGDFLTPSELEQTLAVPMKAGSCSFHNGLIIHGAHTNMTPGLRRAMTCAFVPDGSTFNGISNLLPEEELAHLQVGDLLDNDAVNPLIFKRTEVEERNA